MIKKSNGAHIETTGDVTVLYQVVRRQDGVVRLNDDVRHAGTGEDTESSEHSYITVRTA